MEMENSFSQQNAFKESKEEIIKIFSEVFNYVNDSNEFLRSIHNSGAVSQALINAGDEKSLSNVVERVKGIQSVISRDNMKCAFFGRTSNGKSSTINALLGILPADFGQSTSCFIEIRGTKESRCSVSIISSSKPELNSPPIELVDHKQIDSILKRARDVCSKKLPTDSLIRIAWPSQKCPLLSEDVVILDSPGIDLDPDIDKWINIYCLDADVFVLVVNGTATITKAEKNFFHEVCDMGLKPNVFILNNFWDKSAKNPNYTKIRKQHMERCVNFLTNEIKVCSETEAANRVFFVSAKEALSLRNKKNKCESGVANSLDSSGSTPLREGWQSRQSEFTKFEGILGRTLSESAIKTKFGAHSSQGQGIVGEVRLIVEAFNEKALEKMDAAVRDRNEKQKRCSRLPSLLRAAHDKSIEDISSLSDKVSKMVTDKLHNEVQHLDDVINEFNQKFSDEHRKLNQFEIDLSRHVVDHFNKIMKEFWDNELCKEIEAVSTAILERYQVLVPDKDVSKAKCQPECDDYVSVFNLFDLRISRFWSNISYQIISPDWGDISCQIILPGWGMRSMLISCLSAWEATGNWFKAQFRSYMIDRLKHLIEYVSKCSAWRSQFALKVTLRRLDELVGKHEKKLQANIAQLQSDIQRLKEIIAKSRNLTNTALALHKDLRSFDDKYIRV